MIFDEKSWKISDMGSRYPFVEVWHSHFDNKMTRDLLWSLIINKSPVTAYSRLNYVYVMQSTCYDFLLRKPWFLMIFHQKWWFSWFLMIFELKIIIFGDFVPASDDMLQKWFFPCLGSWTMSTKPPQEKSFSEQWFTEQKKRDFSWFFMIFEQNHDLAPDLISDHDSDLKSGSWFQILILISDWDFDLRSKFHLDRDHDHKK